MSATTHRHRWQTLGTTRICATCDLAQTKVRGRWTAFVPYTDHIAYTLAALTAAETI